MILTGTSGNDTLVGTLESDSLSGLAGNDYLNGGAGADTYLFNLGDGQDTLDDTSNDTSVDQLIFSGTGLTSTNAIVTRLGSSSDLKISFGGIADSVILKNQVSSFSTNRGVESIQFSNGVTWTEAQDRKSVV